MPFSSPSSVLDKTLTCFRRNVSSNLLLLCTADKTTAWKDHMSHGTAQEA